MGYIRHHAIVVTSWSRDYACIAHAKARAIFGDDTTALIESRINGYQTFFVGPDGSKEGWEVDELGNALRNAFIEWLDKQRYDDGSSALTWAEVQYGDDNRDNVVTRHDAMGAVAGHAR